MDDTMNISWDINIKSVKQKHILKGWDLFLTLFCFNWYLYMKNNTHFGECKCQSFYFYMKTQHKYYK
jgi:hypothetical protein